MLRYSYKAIILPFKKEYRLLVGKRVVTYNRFTKGKANNRTSYNYIRLYRRSSRNYYYSRREP